MDPEKAKKHRNPPEYWEYNYRDAIMYAVGIGCQAKSDLRYVYEGHEQFMPLPTYVVAPGLNSTGLYGWPEMQVKISVTTQRSHQNMAHKSHLYVFDKDITNEILKSLRHDYVGYTTNQKQIRCKARTHADIITGVELDYGRILHGEQYIELFKPLPTEGKLRNEARVVDILDKGSVTTYNDMTNEKLAVQQVGSFQVGGGGFGGARTSPEEVQVAEIPSRAPDAVIEERVHPDQCTLYRIGSMDMNPIHINPEMSQLSGFKIPILHGLCTFGFAFRHVLRTWAENDADRFQAVKLRFTTPVIPGQTLRTETWKDGNRIIFQVKIKDTGKTAISNGWVRFSKVSEKPADLEDLTAKL